MPKFVLLTDLFLLSRN